MASSSSPSSPHKSHQYDVFLSFRGEDTRKNFVDHLYDALQRQGIHTYKDDETIQQGKRIDDQLMKSIEDSKFFIIVFSKNYASSSWCMEELVKIMECHKTTDQTAYPVFYDVDPSEVRKQSGIVGEAFAKHTMKEAAEKWREALEEAANLAGWELNTTADGHEAKFINKIVEKISLELCSIHSNIDENLIGMEPRVKDIVSVFETDFEDVRMIGIKGMGGGGKTTLARAVFDQICFQFQGISFVENVREVSKASLVGLQSLQNQVLSDVLKNQGFSTITSVHEGKKLLKNKLRGRKVLIVLDDVDHKDQLEALAGASTWYSKGSRIIITTRDEQVLISHGVKWIIDVNLLSNKEAICLFSRYAFGREFPIQGYENLSHKVVHYAAGLPLTIKVLGSFLCGKDKLEWKDTLRRLKTIPLKETLEKLELSYIGLEDDYKEIFLDVACFLKGCSKDYAIRILECCGFYARTGLRVLEQKSLITINDHNDDQCVGMHDHIEEMGRNIVRRLHPNEPNRHSRLWVHKEIEDILANDLGTEATRCITFWMREFSPEILIKGLGNMKKLRVLNVHSRIVRIERDYFCGDWKFDEVRQYFLNALRFLSWEGYPLCSLPKTFHVNNLVGLEMPYSSIVQLWEGGEKKVLNKLRFLDLSHSNLRTLDLGLTPNLERLDLQGCHYLIDLNVPVGCLKRLVYLDISDCLRFKSFRLESLEVGTLTELHLIIESLDICPLHSDNSLPKFRFSCFYNEKLPSSIGNIEKLLSLGFSACTNLNGFSRSICGLQHLRKLTLEGSIPEAPRDLGRLECLEELNLLCIHIKHVPDSICKLKHLKSLNLISCYQLENLPEDLGHLEHLEELSLLYTSIKQLPNSICMLKHLKSLKLKFCWLLEKLPEDLGRIERLEKLELLSTRIKHLPDSICLLKHLKSLKIDHCLQLHNLPEDLGRLECLEKLIIAECMSLRDPPSSICKMKHLRYFCLPGCIQVEQLPEELGRLECLEELNVEDTGIINLPKSICSLNGLLIVGSRTLLESCGFATEIQTSEAKTFCYI